MLCFTLLRAIFQVQAPGGLYLERRFNGEFFALPVWEAYIRRGLYMEGLIFGILRYFNKMIGLHTLVKTGSWYSQQEWIDSLAIFFLWMLPVVYSFLNFKENLIIFIYLKYQTSVTLGSSAHFSYRVDCWIFIIVRSL